MSNWEDTKRAAQSPFHDGPRGGEPQSLTAAEPSQKPLTEHQALGLAIRAIEQVPDHQPEFVAGLRQAYERGVQNEKLRDIGPELLDRLENVVIAYGMGWDMDGVIEVARDTIDKAHLQQFAREASTPEPERDRDLEPDL